jgi:predicted signal transduction protein with EAL and GGDEF domain
LGHQAGDLLLQQVARRLGPAVRASDTVARLGGDEFAVLLPSSGLDGATRIAERLLEALRAPFVLGQHPVTVGASIGAALAPDHGEDAETLLRHADVAMYVAKRAGGGLAAYAPEQDRYNPSRLALVGELRRAIEEDELVLHFQPQVACPDGRLVGVEALVRWQHPRRGLLAPDEFVPLAEHADVNGMLTQWVLVNALRQHDRWQRAGLTLPVSVNLSRRDLHDWSLPDTVATLLRLCPAPVGHLQVEIAESGAMADATRTLDVLGRLRRLGVRVAIDDFGTGYSSLGYLKRLPVDALKIDRSLVRDLAADENSAAIVRAAIDLGHNLGLVVVAEGIEDEPSWRQVVALGCDVGQGYYLCRPLPAAELAAWAKGRDHRS